MATLSKTAALLALALTAGFGASSLLAATKPAAQSAATQTVTTLGGKFTFNLPKAFTADTLPAGDAADGTAGTNGTMYTNSVGKSVVIVAETVRNDGITIKDKTTLERLRQRGFAQIWALDARADLGATDANADIETVQALLTPEKAAAIVAARGAVDLPIVRHNAEHAEAPGRLMAALAAPLAPRPRVPEHALGRRLGHALRPRARVDRRVPGVEHRLHHPRVPLVRRARVPHVDAVGVVPPPLPARPRGRGWLHDPRARLHGPTLELPTRSRLFS